MQKVCPFLQTELSRKVYHLGARGLQQKVASLFKNTLYQLHDDVKCVKYVLAYENEFYIKPIFGKRKLSSHKKQNTPFVLTKKERKQIGYTELEDICGNEGDIRTYAEDIFEPFEIKPFSEKEEGFVKLYDYMTIKRAKFFTAAAICHLFSKTQQDVWEDMENERTMIALLEVIRKLEIDDTKTGTLQNLEKRLLCRLKDCKTEKIEEIRELSWNVVKKYALVVADLQRQAQKVYDDSILK